MTKFKRGQIWLVNFEPSFGREYKKIRPAIIAESNSHIPHGSLLTVIPISSKLSQKRELDVLLKKDSINRLMKDSIIKINQISSFDKRRMILHIGDISSDIMKNVEQNIRIFLDL